MTGERRDEWRQLLGEHSQEALDWLRRQRQGWLGVVLGALRNTFTQESSFTAAAISYFALFSFFPLILFTTVIAGTWLDPLLNRNQVIEQLNFVAPALGYLLRSNLSRIVGLEETVTGISFITLIWSASSIFYVLRRTLDRIWEVHERRPLWQHRGMAVIAVLLLSGILLLASTLYSTVLSILDLLTPVSLQLLGSFASQAVSLFISIILFAIIYRYLPHFRVTWRDIWPGALAAGILWEIAKRAFFIYATRYLAQSSLTQLIYGSVATIIAFLAWSYMSSMLFIFGAHLNAGFEEVRRQVEGEDLM